MGKNIVTMLCLFCFLFSACPSFGEEDAAALRARIAELESRIAELEKKADEKKDSSAAWDPFMEMERMREDMHHMFEEDFFIPQGGLRMPGLTTEMLFDDQFEIQDEGDSYLIISEVPGMAKESIQVEAKGQVLLISGKRDEKVQEEKPGVSLHQRFFGTFSRSLPLPSDASTDTLDVDYGADVLKIRLKKKNPK